MRKLKYTFLITGILIAFHGCDFIKNTFTYKDKTAQLIEILINEDYDKAIDCFAMQHDMAKNTNLDTMKIGLANFRQIIVDNFGTVLNYKFMKSEKKRSTIKEDNTPPNTTLVMIEFSNDKEFEVFKVLFDDVSGKILQLNILYVKQPIPSMNIFWLFGLLALCIPIFNIYMIVQIKRSDLKKKWLKYIAVIFLNVPTLSYAAVNGLSFKLLSFQILLGVSFNYMGYLSSAWTFGLPLGGIYWFWKLKTKSASISDSVIETEQEIDNKIMNK